MRKQITILILLVLSLVLFVGSAFSLGDNNNTNNNAQSNVGTNTNTNVGTNTNTNNNANNSFINNRTDNDISNTNYSRNENNVSNRSTNINDINNSVSNNNSNKQNQAQSQGQMQGQSQTSVGEVSQGNDQNVNVAGDSTKTTVYANSWPALSGGVGVSQGQAYSIFGGIGASSTEEYKVSLEKLQYIDTMKKLGYFTEEQAQAEVKEAWKQLKYSTQTKRFLGIFWKTSGRDLGNGLGLLAFNSFWSDEPAQKKEPKQRVKKEARPEAKIEGNNGYINQ